MSDDDYEPRPEDYLVEPMFAHLEPREEEGEEGAPADPAASGGWWSALLRLLGRRQARGG